jgi:hypothetical protein
MTMGMTVLDINTVKMLYFFLIEHRFCWAQAELAANEYLDAHKSAG